MSDTQTAIVAGDANELSVGVTKVTIDRILKMEQPDKCLALYMFFAYTARWQKTQNAHCTASYAAQGLGWSESLVWSVKARLVSEGLIENVTRIDPQTSRVLGWYVRVRYLVTVHPPAGDRVESHPPGIPQGGNLTPKCLGTVRVNASETSRDASLFPNIVKNSIPPSKQEVEKYFTSLGLNGDSKEATEEYFDHHEARGWKLGREKMKSWKAACRTWRRNRSKFAAEKVSTSKPTGIPGRNGVPCRDITHEDP